MKIHLLFCSILFLCFALFFSCCSPFSFSNYETFEINLPSWPPENQDSISYPPLSRWKITVSLIDETKSFYTTQQSFSQEFKKNQVAAITIQPLTILSSGNESDYFQPAGIIYPYFPASQDKYDAKWENGFLADLLSKIILSKEETGVSSFRMENFLCKFNWGKAQTEIEKKISKSQEENKSCCNPWLIDSSKFLNNFCYGDFKSSYLNLQTFYDYPLDTLEKNTDFSPISAFIPENSSLTKINKIRLVKNQSRFISDGKTHGYLLLAESEKNILKDFVNMPIYIEEL